MSTLPEFRNEPLTDFTKPEHQSAMNLALAKVSGQVGREHPIVIGGERITGLKTFDSLNPANKQVVGKFQEGSAEHVERAMEAAWTAFESWKRSPSKHAPDCCSPPRDSCASASTSSPR